MIVPLQVWVLLPTSRFQSLCIDFGGLVLEQLNILLTDEVLVAFAEVLLGVITGAEAVHQNKAHIGVKLLARILDLLSYQIKECLVVFDDQKTLGLLKTHGGAQPTVQFENSSCRQELLQIAADLQGLEPLDVQL